MCDGDDDGDDVNSDSDVHDVRRIIIYARAPTLPLSLSPLLLYARTLYALCTARSPLSALSAHCSQRCAACSLFSLAQLSVNASARTSPPPPSCCCFFFFASCTSSSYVYQRSPIVSIASASPLSLSRSLSLLLLFCTYQIYLNIFILLAVLFFALRNF